MFDLPSWMEFLVLQYCTQSDLEYWKHPLICKPKHLTWEQIQSTKRNDIDVIKRGVALDIVMSDIDYLTTDISVMLLYCPFKPNTMTHILTTLLSMNALEWYDKRVSQWFDCDLICDKSGYEWFVEHKLLDTDFQVHMNAVRHDSLELYVMDLPQATEDSIHWLILNNAYQILLWALNHQKIPQSCDSLFYNLMQRNPPLDVVKRFPKPKLIRLPDWSHHHIEFEVLEYLLTHFASNLDGIQILRNQHDHCTIQYMKWAKIDPVNYEWDFGLLRLQSIQLLYDMNPDVFKAKRIEYRPKFLLFYFQNGINVDLEYCFCYHQNHKPHWKARLLDHYPYSPTILITPDMVTCCLRDIGLAKWVVENATKHLNTCTHIRQAFKLASAYKWVDQVQTVIPYLILDQSLLSEVTDASVLRCLVNHYGAVPILKLAKQKRTIIGLMREVYATQRPAFDDQFMAMLQDDRNLLRDLALFYSWPQDVIHLVNPTKENKTVMRLLKWK